MLSRTTLVAIIILFVSVFKLSAQVSLQTGSAVFSLPLFDWKDDKSRLVSSIALSYSSGSGLRVNDIASNVGQGWNLVSGGVITRMQVGEPDDQAAIGSVAPENNQDVTKYPNGYLFGNPAPNNGCPKALSQYPTYGSKNTIYAQHNLTAQDKQLDYFSFQFNGKSGRFIIDPTNGWHAVMLGDTKMQISIQQDPATLQSQGIRTTITSFTITDVDGLIYKFTAHGTTKLLQGNFASADGTKVATAPKISNNGVYCQASFDVGPTGVPSWANSKMVDPYIVTSWYLTEVDDPFVSGRKIQYTYNTLNLTNSVGADIIYNQGSDNYIVIAYKKSIITALEPNSIIYPDGHSVQFGYAATTRFDYAGQKALATVTMSYAPPGQTSRTISQYQLNTTYFILNRYGTPSNAYQKSVARLCLKSVRKIGVDLKEDSPPYSFDYYLGSNNNDDFIPPPFFPAKDIWGYYNGNNSIASNTPIGGTSLVPALLSATNLHALPFTTLKGLCFQNDNVTGTYYNEKPILAANGLLKAIIYPTGGNLVYTYAENTGSYEYPHTADVTVGGVHVSQTSSTDNGYSNGCATPVITNYSYVTTTGGSSSLWGLETPVNAVTNVNSWKEEKQTIHFSLSNPLGSCLWHYVYPGIQAQYEAVSIEEFQKIMVALGPVLGVLGVVSTVQDVMNVMDSACFWNVAFVVIDVISAVLGYVLSCPQKSKTTTSTVFYNYDLNQISPLPAQFKRVEIIESSGTIGKTIQQFTHGDPNDPAGADYPLWYAISTTNSAFAVKQRFAPWAYGLPKLTTVLDASGDTIRQTQNIYDFSSAQTLIQDAIPAQQGQVASIAQSASPQSTGPPPPTIVPLTSCKCLVNNNYSQRSDVWSDATQYNNVYYLPGANADINTDIYKYYTGHVQLVTTYDRTYRTTDHTQYVQTQTNYSYNNDIICPGCTNTPGNFDLNQVVTYQSNGDAVYKHIFYTSDYNNGILATLVGKNIMSLPVTTQTSVVKAGTSAAIYLSEKVTEFALAANGDVRPSRVIEQRLAAPSATLAAYSGPASTNYSNYKIPQTFYYDANSNLAGVYDEGGRAVTNVYDYNDKYIVASVINADPTVDKAAYSSFESGDLSRSGWTLTGTASYLSTSGETGSSCFVLAATGANYLTASSLNTAKPYTLSFWANNSNVSVSGGTATLAKSGPTYNGFTYYEYTIAAGASNLVVKDNASGSVNIDELRLYPSTARMRTTTYDPLIGKTSECDENNRITYYTYDNLGRMQTIQNETHQIVKVYEYNNVSPAKLTGCPTAYGSKALTELVTPTYCTPGLQGIPVTYTMPAGQFVSHISQEDADFQAEVYFLTNAPAYANANGTCAHIYSNAVQSQTDTVQTCAPGFVGGTVVYTVAAGTYTSIISQADADQQASDDITANAQAWANDPVNASNCSVNTNPDWEWFPGDGITPADPSYCSSATGLPPHLFVLATDVNPNSATYNQTEYWDYGPNSACPANYYYNASYTQAFTKACSAGYIGSSVNYTVPPGKYSSTTSQAAADAQATADATANGQNYANANGTCTAEGNVTYQDTRAFQYTVRFTNNGTGVLYTFTPNANSNGTLGQVPQGTYTVSICPINNYTANNNYDVGSQEQLSVVCATFNNVVVGSSGIFLSFF